MWRAVTRGFFIGKGPVINIRSGVPFVRRDRGNDDGLDVRRGEDTQIVGMPRNLPDKETVRGYG